MPFRIVGAQTFAVSLVGLYQIFALWQLSMLVDEGSAHLLPVMRSAVIATLVIALIIFLNHVYNSAELKLHPEPHTTDIRANLPESVRGDLDEHVARYQGHVIRPIRVELTTRYHSLTRAFATRLLTVVAVGNALVFVALLAIALPLTLLLGDDASADVAWTVRMMLGVLVIPLVLAAGTYSWLFVMQYRNRFVLLAATAFALTFLPPALTYLAGGESSLSGSAAIVNGIAAVVITAIVDLVKEYAARPASAKQGHEATA